MLRCVVSLYMCSCQEDRYVPVRAKMQSLALGSGRCPSAESASISYFVSSEIDADSADGHSRAPRVRLGDRPAHNRHRFNTLFQVKMMPIQQDDLASERPCLPKARLYSPSLLQQNSIVSVVDDLYLIRAAAIATE